MIKIAILVYSFHFVVCRVFFNIWPRDSRLLSLPEGLPASVLQSELMIHEGGSHCVIWLATRNKLINLIYIYRSLMIWKICVATALLPWCCNHWHWIKAGLNSRRTWENTLAAIRMLLNHAVANGAEMSRVYQDPAQDTGETDKTTSIP